MPPHAPHELEHRAHARFVRFARHGDPEDLAAVFDDTALRLLRVALLLTRDPAQAEDLLQSTFVTAMEKAREFDAARPVLPWLSGILRHHAHDLRRAAARRPDPELLAPAISPDPAGVAQHSELDGAVCAALDRMSGADRSLLVLELRHGLVPAEIADVLEIPPGTVRVRLHRAKERLRRLLPASFASALALGVTPARGLAAVRSALCRQAAAAKAAAGGGVVSLLGGLLVTHSTIWKTAAAAALLLLATATTISLWLGDDARAVPAPATTSDPLQPTVETDGAGRVADSAAVSAGPSRREVVAPDAAARAADQLPALRVRARSAGGDPLPGVLVAVYPADGRLTALHARRQVTDARGDAAFEALPAGSWHVHADRPQFSSATPSPEPEAGRRVITGAVRGQDGVWGMTYSVMEPRPAPPDPTRQRDRDALADRVATSREGLVRQREFAVDEPTRPTRGMPEITTVEMTDTDVVLDLRFVAGQPVTGLVRTPDGVPVAGATVRWVHEDGSIDPRSASTDELGRFEVLDLPPRAPRLFATIAGHAPGTAVRPDDRTVELTLGPAAGLLSGRVRGADGLPLPDARVRVGEAGGGRPLARPEVDSEGRFGPVETAVGLIPVLVLAPGHEPWQGWTQVAPGQTVDVEVRLEAGWTATGRGVRADDGSPAVDVTVAARADGRPTVEVRSGSDGEYELDCLPVGDVTLTVAADARHFEVTVTARGHAGEVQRHDLQRPTTGLICGRLLDARGRGLSSWRIAAIPVDGGDPASGWTGGDGSFELSTSPGQAYRLEAQARLGPVRPLPPSRDSHIVVGGSTLPELDASRPRVTSEQCGLGPLPSRIDGLDMVVPDRFVPSAGIYGSVSSSDGIPLEGTLVVVGEHGTWRYQLRRGEFDTGQIPPGIYTFKIEPAHDRGGFDLVSRRLDAEQVVDLGALVEPPG